MPVIGCMADNGHYLFAERSVTFSVTRSVTLQGDRKTQLIIGNRNMNRKMTERNRNLYSIGYVHPLCTDILLIFATRFVGYRSKQFVCFKQWIQVCAGKIGQIIKAEMFTNLSLASWFCAKFKNHLRHNLVSILVTILVTE